MSHALSMETYEWYTPAGIVERVRVVMGGIDLDPASCEAANGIVGAANIYSQNGLEYPWFGRVFCNPPSPAKAWWEKLIVEYGEGRLTEAVFVGNSRSRSTTPEPSLGLNVHKRGAIDSSTRSELKRLGYLIRGSM